MKARTSDEIRRSFLEFFKARGHAVVDSSGVVPRNDPTLLFTNAGMVQFKDVFLGADRREYSRATTSQKCVRMSGKHNDLDNVGRTARHHTFFEMLGNFSFGDYFKREAIAFAWELLTEVWGLDRSRLVITVFGGEDGLAADDEAREIWREVTGFGDERIIGLGRKDNFWSMGDTGPCGPCTEVHYFMGEGPPSVSTFGEEPTPDGRGWMEIWNLVFMQYNRAEKNGPLAPLPSPCVDTGMGLERIAAVLQGVTSNYDTDVLRPLVLRAAELAQMTYRATDEPGDIACRVIADHARMAAFALAEGVTPSNKDRGAALRSVMRRAIRFAFLQGVNEPTFHHVAAKVIEVMGAAWPELVQHRDFIVSQCEAEDRRFRETIPTGLALLERFESWNTGAGGEKVLPGEVAFDLYATHGFPRDLTEVIGRERGFVIDEAGFERARNAHSDVSRGETEGVSKQERVQVEHRRALELVGAQVEFTGYVCEQGESDIAALISGRYGDPAVALVKSLEEGNIGQLVTRATPFYGEAGGQVGDRGVITTANGEFAVEDTQKPVGGLVVHIGRVTRGVVSLGERAVLTVDHESRAATRRNHSATHLLHWALREAMGSHAQQKGSKVGPDGLRFDFALSHAIGPSELRQIEARVNREVLDNREVRTVVTTQEEARAQGATMIFEEKYGDSVRMLYIGSESVELCGGTHVSRTGDIGLFKIVSETNVGAGVRRIEAVTGMGALALLCKLEDSLGQAARMMKAAPAEVVGRLEKTLEQQRELQRQLDGLQRGAMFSAVERGVTTSALGDGVTLVVGRAPSADDKAMREAADHLRDKHEPAVVVLGAVSEDGRAMLVCTVSKQVTTRFHAGKLVGALAARVGGRGGGRADMAGAGGPNGAAVDTVLGEVHAIVA